MRKLIFIIACIGVLGCSKIIKIKNVPSDNSNNLMFGASPQREFFIAEDVSDSLELIWEKDTKGSHSHTSVTVKGEYLFIGDLAGVLNCINLSTGKLVGEIKHEGGIAVAPVVGDYRIIYVVNNLKKDFSTLIIYDYIRGKIRFELDLPGKFTNELLIEDENIYLLSEEGLMFKYNSNGEKLWEYDSKGLTITVPAIYNDQILFSNIEGEIISVDKENGELNYRKKISESFESGISISGNLGFIGDTNGELYCFNCDTQNIEWTFDSRAKIKALAVYDFNNLYVGNLAGDYFSINKKSGIQNWKVSTGGLLNMTPLVFNNYIVLPDQAQKIHFINKADGTITNSMEFEKRIKLTPVYNGNTLFLGEDRGNIYAYKFVN